MESISEWGGGGQKEARKGDSGCISSAKFGKNANRRNWANRERTEQ